MHHIYLQVTCLVCSNIELVSCGGLIMSMFHFLSFGTPHTFSDVPHWLCMVYLHIWYHWIQNNPIFPTSHHMCFYDNPWPGNYNVNENILHRYSFFACPLILGKCSKVSICYTHQDIHIQVFLIGKATSWPQLCQVSKLSELLLLIYMSLYILTPIRPGCILVLF